jgi:hypothetical protein
MKQRASEIVISRLAGPIAVWAVTQLLQRPSVKGALREVDSRALEQTKKAKRGIRRARENALSNPVWLIAGAAAIAVGIGLIARAASRRS